MATASTATSLGGQDSAAPAAPSRKSAGTQLIVDALRARQAGDWVKADSLALVYRQSFPAGPLEEEALMLTLEAAAARGASTREPAEQYLRRFPKGRYQKWAASLLARAR
jgi:hypothetical protein